MKTKFKKCLTAVFALSLLSVFCTSVASFAMEYYEPSNKRRFGCYERFMNNRSVAESFGIEIQLYEEGEVTYIVKDNDDSFSIIEINTNASVVYVPEILDGKSLVIDDDFKGFSWSESGWPTLFYVPKRLKEPFERIKERVPYNREINFDVISYEDLFNPGYTF